MLDKGVGVKLFLSVLMTGVVGATAWAGDAVSGINGKLGYLAGDMDGNRGNNVEGSISLPVGRQYGVQVDALYSDVSGRDFYGLGSHLFWRNSTNGLLGITCGAVRENDLLDSWAGGVEGEYYLGKFTFGSQMGLANINYQGGPLPFIETDKTDFYVSGSVGYYPMDNLLLSFSYTQSMDNGMGRFQVEHQTHFPGVCVYGDVAVGEYDYSHTMIGVRYYFGKKKNLILRHREDDPNNYLKNMLYTIGSYGAEFNSNANRYVASGGSGGGSDGGYGLIISIIGGSSGDFGSSVSVGNASARRIGPIGSTP